MKKCKNGISLIVLVITVIVMMILVSAVIISLENNGIIEKASQSAKRTDERQVQDLATLIWTDAYLDPAKKENIVNVVKRELASEGITEDEWNIVVDNLGVTVTRKKDNEDRNEISPDSPIAANRPFKVRDYTCVVEWASNMSGYTIACDAMDKNCNPVYILKAGMTKAEYDAMGLKYRKGSWIYIWDGRTVSSSSTGYYSEGDILDYYAASIMANTCAMYQVNGNGKINVNKSAGSINKANSGYTTVLTSPYSTAKYVDVFANASDSAVLFNSYCIFIADGTNQTSQSKTIVTPFDMSLSYWNASCGWEFIPGSLVYCNYELVGKFVKVASDDGYNAYIVTE